MIQKLCSALSLLLLLMLTSNTCMAIFTTNLTDHSALIGFKSAITIDPNNVLGSNWIKNINFCNWVGVTCSPRRQRVTELHLRSMGLVGTLSPHIGNLSFLTTLDLHNNSFHGHLIYELAHLRRLKKLILPFNNFEGAIPASLQHCQKLQFISLPYNNLNGAIPEELTTLPQLHVLFLGKNNLTGTIPPSIGNMSSLELLGLELNRIHGNIPHETGRIENLKGIFLGKNYITGSIPPSLFNISSLEQILLGFNGLSGNLPSSLGLWLPKLQLLHLQRNNLSGNIPISLSNSSMLTELHLNDNQFSGAVPRSLGHLELLVKLSLSRNQLTREPGSHELSFLRAFTGSRYLKQLALSDNPFHGVLPDTIGNLSSSLLFFYAFNCQLYGKIPKGIGFLKNMIYLVLADNNLSGTIPSTIKGMGRLQRITLEANILQGSIPDEICLLSNLGDVGLQSNRLSGPIPGCIGNLTNLQHLLLGSNLLNSSIPSSLWSLQNLIYLNLSFNALNGSLGMNVKQFRSLEGIDLSWNRFSSNIPTIMGAFESMIYLDMSGNTFSGSIPDSFGNLLMLDFLDLAHNNLSGTIPMSLKALSHLHHLNLSYNELEGEIPSGGPFERFTWKSFMQNWALCGQPVLGFPPCKTHGIRKSKSRQWPYKYILPAIGGLILVCIFLLLKVLKMYRGNTVETQNSDSDKKLNAVEHINISYQELCRATNNFSETNLIGVGGFGSVYKGILSDGTTIAVKILNLEVEGAFKSFDAECKVLRTFRHRNLVKVISSCSNNELRALILQYMPNGSLEKWLYNHTYNLDLLQRVSIMIDVAFALEYLHLGQQDPVVHCDLKPNNVLLDEDMVAHLADFGISKILHANNTETQTSTLGTLGYIAPEYGLEGKVSTKGDIYSYGILLLETFTRKKPTDEMFTSELNLKQWVNASFPEGIMEIADNSLLEKEYGHMNPVQSNLISIMEVGLACTKEVPEERSDIKEVVVKLNKIKLQLLQYLQVQQSVTRTSCKFMGYGQRLRFVILLSHDSIMAAIARKCACTNSWRSSSA